MSVSSLSLRIVERARAWNVDLAQPDADRLAAYLALLGRWNRRINLTGLTVDPPDEGAIDRLVIEPVVAAGLVGAGDHVVLDIGSGAGSPAIPLKVMRSAIRLVMVEARARKAAFLRAAVRELALVDCLVETRRFGEKTEDGCSADVVTLRAVRPDRVLLAAVSAALAPGGRLLCFGCVVESPGDVGLIERSDRLVLPGGSFLSSYAKAPV